MATVGKKAIASTAFLLAAAGARMTLRELFDSG
jgi:hypothetical protein